MIFSATWFLFENVLAMLLPNALRSPTPIKRRTLLRASLLGPASLFALCFTLTIVTIILAELAQYAHLDPRVLEAIEFLGFASGMTTLIVGMCTIPACLFLAIALWTGWGGWLIAVFCGMSVGSVISWGIFATPVAAFILVAAGAVCGLVTWLGARIFAPEAFDSKN
ncbi:hypothetical protein [Hoeflea alexandrii]